MASSPVWSCHAPVIRARRWIMAVTIFFFLVFFLHCLADHLLLQLTCEWSWWPRWLTPGEPESGKSCERWRETERESKRPRPNTPTHTHTNTHTLYCASTAAEPSVFLRGRDATFMQREAVIFFWVQEFLARCWHDAPGSDRCCHPDSEARPPTRQELSARAARRPRTVLGAWSQLGTERSTNRWSRFNCVTLGGEKKKTEKKWLQWSMKPWAQHSLLHLQFKGALRSIWGRNVHQKRSDLLCQTK